MKQERFIYLINQHVNKTISVEETMELKDLLTEMEQPRLTEVLGETWLSEALPLVGEGNTGGDIQGNAARDIQSRIAAIVAVDKQDAGSTFDLPSMPEQKVHRLSDGRSNGRSTWFRYAAAAVIILVIGGLAYFRLANKNPSHETAPTVASHDIQPGRQTAILTLADGTRVSLDSAGDGVVATQGKTAVTKLAGGQIVYQSNGTDKGEASNGTGKGKAPLNTMATPRGGQYQLVLPDGTKVWLNAASAITYPVAFDGERKVKVTGEVYFEVAKNKEGPFIVDIEGKSSIEVLGTGFNVNAYPDEEHIRTTLVEGKIKVVDNMSPQSVVLKPGQQAVIRAEAGDAQQQAGNSIAIVGHADLEQVLAWKNGLIDLENIGLPELMRQLERWYDIQVKYEGAIPKIKFKGEMDRGVRLSGVLHFLQNLGIRTRLENKTLIVMESDPSKTTN